MPFWSGVLLLKKKVIGTGIKEEAEVMNEVEWARG